MLADIPDRRHRRAYQPSGKNATGLHRGPTEDVTRMRRVVTPVVDDIENLGADNAAQDDQNAEVPGIVWIDPLLARIADADPQSDQNAGRNQQPVRGEKKLADMKKLGKHY